MVYYPRHCIHVSTLAKKIEMVALSVSINSPDTVEVCVQLWPVE